VIDTNAASLMRRGLVWTAGSWVPFSSKLVRLYDVHWKTSHMTYYEATKNYYGEMEGVTGTFYEDDVPSATFSADNGTVDKVNDVLDLDGHVHVVGIKKPGTMTCDHLTWYPEEEARQMVSLLGLTDHSGMVQGKGNVTVTLLPEKPDSKVKGAVIGPSDELWSSGDFQTVATPDLVNHP